MLWQISNRESRHFGAFNLDKTTTFAFELTAIDEKGTNAKDFVKVQSTTPKSSQVKSGGNEPDEQVSNEIVSLRKDKFKINESSSGFNNQEIKARKKKQYKMRSNQKFLNDSTQPASKNIISNQQVSEAPFVGSFSAKYHQTSPNGGHLDGSMKDR